jgi:diguanylate cyclase
MAAEPVAVGGHELQVTTSIGVAVAAEGEDGVALIRRADDALYRAKAAGRNCVEMG